MANTQTLKELAAPELIHQPLCITFPTLAENTAFELKSGLIHLLPSFHGLSGEERHKHVKEFEVVCSSMKPPEVTEEQIRLRVFPFSLMDAAKDWLYYLPACSIITWAQLKKKFLEKFFPASRAASLRKEICSIKQYSGEFLYEYWERFNKLCTRCPQYQISEQLLIQYFYKGLQSTDRSIIDAASGRALANKTPKEAWELIEARAENSQQFGFRESNPTRRVNEVESTSIQQQLSELTSVVRQLAVGNVPQVKACGICTNMGHHTDSCPMLQEDGAEQKSQPSPSNSGSSLEEIVKSLTTTTTQLQQETRTLVTTTAQLQQETRSLVASTTQFQQDTKAGMKDMETRMSQMATAINRLESHVYGKLPSQPEANPKNVSAMTLRCGKEVEGPRVTDLKSKSEDKIEKEIEEEGHIRGGPGVTLTPSLPVKSTLPPFPCRLAKTKKAEKEKEILDVFKKVEINIPLLEAIKQVSKYAKFLKDLCSP
ncbi:uncharacterized protein LOC113752439 [Coffea eugenioides]|uniref:uncharacterized protein LOC113752439 n=1 Tax=Coffea eugenioides TaxID=49369 RepID=UPI000F607762|nr:uncharacterized protein LOC113752439 [Coffea eugenioides]